MSEMTSQQLLGLLQGMDDSDIKRENIVKAPFPYPGGKDTALPMILPHLPYTDYYCEPFGGSGVVLLARKKCKNEFFNDRQSGVTDFYRCIKDRALCEKLLAWLDFTPFSREEFNRCRDTWKDHQDPVERAARWYCMVVFSFQAYGRHYGRSKTAVNRFSMKLPNSLQSFWPVHYRLQGTYIENQDWRGMFQDLNNHNRVWYLDPPYLPTKENNAGMYEHNMTEADHIEMCEKLFKLQGYVALSGYDNEVYNSFPWTSKYSWEQISTANASIATESNNKKGNERNVNEIRTECLWIKDFSS